MAGLVMYHKANTGIYSLSLHDALPISGGQNRRGPAVAVTPETAAVTALAETGKNTVDMALYPVYTPLRSDRKSTRLNSSHVKSSYAVLCLKKKKKIREIRDKKPNHHDF